MTKETDRRKLEEKAYQLGFQYEKICKGCSQCAVAAIQDALGIRDDSVFKAASGLAAGGAMTGIGVCGGYVGGAMVIGQLCGRDRDNFEDPEGLKFISLNITKSLTDAFLREFGSIICRDVQIKFFGRPYYIRDQEEFLKFEEDGAHQEKCTHVVGKASQIAVRIILEEGLVKI